jgi:hypothetical protein
MRLVRRLTLYLLLAIGLIFAPLVYRFFHRLHLELEDDAGSGGAAR